MVNHLLSLTGETFHKDGENLAKERLQSKKAGDFKTQGWVFLRGWYGVVVTLSNDFSLSR